jgi:O-6-methylguanine DNA methyltransferase
MPAVGIAAVPGPWGPIHVAATARGVVAIDILAPEDVFRAELAARLGPLAEADPDETVLQRGLAAVQSFLAGDPAAFDGVPLDLEDRPAWDRAVLAAVRDVPWGATSSYGGIAAAIGRRGAARAVGGAVGRNPISLAIPCHRVIAGDGSLGGYGGGWWGSRELRLGLKRDLLAREGTVIGGASHNADRPIVAQATREALRPR